MYMDGREQIWDKRGGPLPGKGRRGTWLRAVIACAVIGLAAASIPTLVSKPSKPHPTSSAIGAASSPSLSISPSASTVVPQGAVIGIVTYQTAKGFEADSIDIHGSTRPCFRGS